MDSFKIQSSVEGINGQMHASVYISIITFEQCIVTGSNQLRLWELVPRFHTELILKMWTDPTSPSVHPPFFLDSAIIGLK